MHDRRLRVALHVGLAVAFWIAVVVPGCSAGDLSGEGPIPDASTGDTTLGFETGAHDAGADGGDGADGSETSTCPPPKKACEAGCIDTSSDPKNCGVCGAVCASPLVCGNGQCTIACPTGQTQCSGACVDLNKDFDNCGSCAHACSAGQVCDQGSCKLYCGPPNTACNGVCVNTGQDGANCGACGTQCPAGQLCSGGQCAVSCGLLTTCQGDAGAYCVNTQSDQANCGSCGNACGQGKVCSNGSCAVSCQPGQVNCGGSCIDPATNPQFCGASGACGAGGNGSPGTVCGAGQFCAAGSCATSCPPGEVLCGGLCIDPKASNAHCGATAGCGAGGVGSAGTACPSGQVCSGGACTTTCVQGQVLCPVGGIPTCVDPLTNPSFCGASGNCQGTNAGKTCPSGQVCSGGACQTTCVAGQIVCNGVCIDPLSNNKFCGASANCQGSDAGKVCPSGQVCTGGQCAATCAATQALCNGQCTDPKTSPTNCGAAAGGTCSSPTQGDPNYEGQACGPLTQCAPGGVSGTTYACRSTCTGGGTQCFPSGGTPYCANTDTDNNNCGACGNKCGALQSCDGAGHCASTCATGQSPCPAASSPNPTTPYCADLQTDNGNCGTCNHVCAANRVCSGGACGTVCGAGQTFCTQTGVPYCALTQTDANNCGGCGNVCGGSCVTGTCCPAGSTAICNGSCTNTNKDAANCGSCGHACGPSAPFCIGGSCQATLYATASLSGTKKLVFLFAPAGTAFTSNADYSAYCAAHGFTQNQNFDSHAEYVSAGMSNPNVFYCGAYCCYLGVPNDRAKNFDANSFQNVNLPLNTPLRVFDRGCGDFNCGSPGSFTTGLNTVDQLVVIGSSTFTYTDDAYGANDQCTTKSTTLPVDGVIVCETN